MANYDNDGCIRLAEAVIKQAVQDYGRAIKMQHQDPDNIIAGKTIRDCENFFLKDVDIYLLGQAIAGPSVLKSVQNRVFQKHNLRSAC